MSENSMSSSVISSENIAVNRFGYGARGDELRIATWLNLKLVLSNSGKVIW